jgi:hypothetical protein
MTRYGAFLPFFFYFFHCYVLKLVCMYNVVIFLTIIEKYFYWNFSYVSKKNEVCNKIFIRIHFLKIFQDLLSTLQKISSKIL